MEIDLRYTEIEARRFGEARDRVNVNNNSTITAVSRVDDKMSLEFVFTSSYEPDVGEIKIKGRLLVSDSEENIRAAMEAWEESGQKNLPRDMAENVHNLIISNCVIETVILSREIQLPSPVPMPRISMKDKEKPGSETESYIR